MKRVIHRGLAVFVPLVVAACAGASAGAPPSTALTRIGQAVQVTEMASRARECEFVADIPVRTQSPDDADAMRALRNDAGTAGANLVLLVMQARSIERAEGYLCADE